MSGPENRDFFTDKSLVDDPYQYYDAIRRCPVWREPAHGVVMVSGYDEAVAVHATPRRPCRSATSSAARRQGFRSNAHSDDISDRDREAPRRITFGDYFITFDPPRHTAHRSLLSRLFTPKRLKNNEDFLWRLADEQIDRFAADGSARSSSTTTCRSRSTRSPTCSASPRPIVSVSAAQRQPADIEGERSGFVGVKEEWFVEYVEARRREPRDDVLTELASAKYPDGSTPDAIDVARVATFMYAAGHGTTIDLLSLAVLMLAERPDLQAAAACGPLEDLPLHRGDAAVREPDQVELPHGTAPHQNRRRRCARPAPACW